MRKKHAERALESHFAPKFPGLDVRGDLLVERNGPVLSGIAIERSQMAADVFGVVAFAQLLTIPSDMIVLNLSRELGSFHLDEGEEEVFEEEVFKEAVAAAEQDGKEFLARARTPEALLTNVDSLASAVSDSRVPVEVRAHCLILRGDCDAARTELEVFIDALDPPDAPWEREWLERALALKSATERSCPEAVELLDEWRQQTLANLSSSLPAAVTADD